MIANNGRQIVIAEYFSLLYSSFFPVFLTARVRFDVNFPQPYMGFQSLGRASRARNGQP